MARYKDTQNDHMKMIPVSFEQQILPGTFEHSLAWLVDNDLDLTAFDNHYQNDETGRPAYDPKLLLKVVIFAYSKGVTSSRRIERLCRENITFMALSLDSQPHFTTIADFISRSPEAIADLFTQIVLMCDHLGLIGKEMFAIDGCKLPSNAAKEWSGTHEELTKKHQKLDRAVRRILKKHKETDQSEQEPEIREQEQQQVKKLRAASKKIKTFLAENEKRSGVSGKEVKSNITDNESAKMKTSHGVIQGYTGVAAVDSKHQVVLQAEAFGQGQEQGLLKPMVEAVQANFSTTTEKTQEAIREAKVTADAGYHNQATLEYLEDNGIDGYLADTGFRSRDPRFKDYKEPKERNKRKQQSRFTQSDFAIDTENQTCRCPAGHEMWLKAKQARIGQHLFMQFQAYEKDCPNCRLKHRCLRNAEQTTPRQINVKLGTTDAQQTGPIERMKQKIDSALGRHIYSQRLGTVENPSLAMLPMR
jgi:transposase